jgi:hypothetical protein
MIGASLNLPLPRRPRRTLTAVLQAMECARALIGMASSWEKSPPMDYVFLRESICL